MSESKVKQDVLLNRFRSIGWTKSELARKVAEVRRNLYGDVIEDPNALINGLSSALESPEKSSGKILESLVIAMGGEIDITWKIERIIQETKKVSFSESSDEITQIDI